MRFSIIAAAFMASTAYAGSTITVTDEVTITSCAATVTNCPARSTVTSLTSYLTTTSAPVYFNTSAMAAAPSSTPVSVATSEGVETSASVSLSTITISTCIPTVIYSTVSVAPTATSPPVVPSSGPISVPSNGTAPTATAAPTQFTGAASHITGSAFVAGLGMAAFLFA